MQRDVKLAAIRQSVSNSVQLCLPNAEQLKDECRPSVEVKCTSLLVDFFVEVEFWWKINDTTTRITVSYARTRQQALLY